MRTVAAPHERRASRPPSQDLPAPAGFDAAAAILSAIFVGGLYLDGWAHVHGHVDGSFFTPWHAVLYSGYLLLAGLLVAAARRGRQEGRAIRSSTPAGYELSLLGAAVFVAGGIGDLIWHLIFGFEVSVNALYSPTHLVLATGGVLMASGPLRSAWRGIREGDVMPWPAVLSLLVVLSVLTFFLQIAHPLVDRFAQGARPDFGELVFLYQALGVAGVVLQTALLMGLVLLAARRFVLPNGALTAIFGLNALALSFLSQEIGGSTGSLRLVPAMVVAGLLADVLYVEIRRRRPGSTALGLRLLAACVPAILYLLEFLTLIATTGIWWSVHLWLGSVAVAGITGFLLSYLMVPPATPAPGPPQGPPPGLPAAEDARRSGLR